MVTGAAPADKTERDALEAAGWKPFSIRIGDAYVDYRRMDPFASILGIAATLGQPQTPHGKPVDLASAFVSGFLGQLTDKTFLTGLSDFVAAASDETGSKLEAWVKRFGGSFVPALASQTAQIIDPSKRVTETLADTMQSRIPGMSQDLPAQRDILGDDAGDSRAQHLDCDFFAVGQSADVYLGHGGAGDGRQVKTRKHLTERFVIGCGEDAFNVGAGKGWHLVLQPGELLGDVRGNQVAPCRQYLSEFDENRSQGFQRQAQAYSAGRGQIAPEQKRADYGPQRAHAFMPEQELVEPETQ
jgi:hypothetical protein